MKKQTKTTIASSIIIGVTVFTIIFLNYAIKKISEKTPPSMAMQQKLIPEEALDDIAKPKKPAPEKASDDRFLPKPPEVPVRKSIGRPKMEPEAPPPRTRHPNDRFEGPSRNRYEDNQYPPYPSENYRDFPPPFPPDMSEEERLMIQEQMMEEHRRMMEEMPYRPEYLPEDEEQPYYPEGYDEYYEGYEPESKRKQKLNDIMVKATDTYKAADGYNEADEIDEYYEDEVIFNDYEE